MIDVEVEFFSGSLTGTEGDDRFVSIEEGLGAFNLAIDLRGGNDLFSATTVTAGGVGIGESVAQGGTGNDTIGGFATDPTGGIGIGDSLIVMGDGDDIINAGGATRGIEGAILVGGAGNDTFNITNGIGVIVGGEGDDLLTLAGSVGDYDATPLYDVDDDGAIDLNPFLLIEGAVTDLKVTQVERFRFGSNLEQIFAINDSGDFAPVEDVE